MTQNKYILYLLGFIMILTGCTKVSTDDISFVKSATAPTAVNTVFSVSTDNSGMVAIKPNSEGASYYNVYFGDTSVTPAKVMAGQSVNHKYKEGTFSVKIVSTGITGLTTENTFPLTVTFREPEKLVVNISSEVHLLKISATADYAKGGYKVYFGEDPVEVPQMMAEGAFLTHNYAKAGTYVVKVVALSGGAASKTVSQAVTIYNALKLPMTFEDPGVLYNWGDFGGSQTKVIPNPYKTGINTSATVGKIVKLKDQTWAGNYIILSEVLDLSQKHIFKVKVYSTRVGMRVQLQLERSDNNFFQDNREVLTTKANQWEELVFDFSGVDNSKNLQNMLFFIDNGVQGDGSEAFTLLFDDITLTN